MKNSLVLILFSVLLSACSSTNNTGTIPSGNSPKDYVAGELLVGFKAEQTYEVAIRDLEKNEGVELIDLLMMTPPDAIIAHFKVPTGKEEEMIAVFQKHPAVKYAELNLRGTFINLPDNGLPVLTVTRIENGRDGYTAHLEDDQQGKYTMVVSIPNLGDKYVNLQVGDQVKAVGEYAESDPVQIFATSIEVVSNAASMDEKYIKGEVESVENGKDGYTATIKTEEGEVYVVTISIPNLGPANADQYRSVSVGEIIEVAGEHWLMGDEKRITVKAMKPAGE